MRDSLERLSQKVWRVDADNLYQAVSELKQVMYEMIEQIDKALPLEVDYD